MTLPTPSCGLSWASRVTLEADGNDLVLHAYARHALRLRLRQPDAALRHLVALLNSQHLNTDAL